METKALESVDLILGEAENRLLALDYEIGKESFSVTVKPYLTIQEKRAFVYYVTNGCFTDDGEYLAELKEMFFLLAFVQMMTNLPIPTIYQEEFQKEIIDVEKLMRCVDKLNLMQRCIESDATLKRLMEELKTSVNEKIYGMLQKNS